MSDTLVEVKNLKQYFPVRSGFKTIPLKAVDDVSFEVGRGETLGLVGESGCGKTTVGRTILRLYQPTGGEIRFDGELVTDKNITAMRKQMQMVFQDPYSSLDPRMTVEDIIGEPLDVHHLCSNRRERREKILELMSYVCDEPVSALDVSIQAQVINMFEELQEKLGVAYLFIAHDLLVVHHISKRIAVMYLGKIVEVADSDELNEHPVHPYTESLLSAVPIPDPDVTRARKRILLEGDVPSPLNMPTGCAFRTRCRFATEQCAHECPALTDRGGGHFVACWNK